MIQEWTSVAIYHCCCCYSRIIMNVEGHWMKTKCKSYPFFFKKKQNKIGYNLYTNVMVICYKSWRNRSVKFCQYKLAHTWRLTIVIIISNHIWLIHIICWSRTNQRHHYHNHWIFIIIVRKSYSSFFYRIIKGALIICPWWFDHHNSWNDILNIFEKKAQQSSSFYYEQMIIMI